MATRLRRFLDAARTRMSMATHTEMPDAHGNRAGKYYVTSAEGDAFFDAYVEALESGCNDLRVVEQHRFLSPVLVDLDFRQDDSARHYSIDDHVIPFAVALCDEVASCISGARESIGNVFVLEKPAPRLAKGQVWKDGVHVVIPGVVTRPELQHAVRSALIDRGALEVFAPLRFTNSVDDIYDSAVIERNGWFMYGSKKGDEPHPWVLSCVLDPLGNVVWTSSEGASAPFASPGELARILSIRNKLDATHLSERGQRLIDEWEEASDQAAQASHELSRHVAPFPEAATTFNLDVAKVARLTAMMSDSRADDEYSWMAVGWALHHVCYSNGNGNGRSEEFFDIWVQFSRRCSSKFDLGECRRRWANIKPREQGFNYGSLRKWAKQDSPEAYTAFLKEEDNAKRPFIALFNTSVEAKRVAQSFEAVCRHIVARVLHIKQDVKCHVVMSDERSNTVLLRLNFGLHSLRDMRFFKRIVRFFCKTKVSSISLRKLQAVAGFDDSIYSSHNIPEVSDEFPVNFYLEPKESLQSVCDRYIVKTVQANVLQAKLCKSAIKSDYHRDVLEDLVPSEVISPALGEQSLPKFLLSFIPSRGQTDRVWRMLGMCIFNERLERSVWEEWDPERGGRVESLWAASSKASPPPAYFNVDFLAFVASVYYKGCDAVTGSKIKVPNNPGGLFEHAQMVHNLYDSPENIPACDHHTYHNGVVPPIKGWCEPFDLVNYDIYSSVAPLGSGKSHCSIEAVRQILLANPNTTIIVPTSRQTYADNITKRYSESFGEGFDFLCYKGASNAEIVAHPRLVIQLESLVRLDRNSTYDIVIADEIESLLAQLSSPTMATAFEGALARFLHVLCSASKIILCDAFSSRRTACLLNFLMQHHRSKDVRGMHSVNNAKTISRTAYRVGTITGSNKQSVLGNLLQHMVRKIRQSKKIVIVSGSRLYLQTILESLQAEFPQLRIKSYTALTDDNVCTHDLRNCEDVWEKDCDVVSWTSKVLIGVNFSIPDVFDSIFVIGDNRTCCVRDMHQSIMRVRYLISDEIYFVTTNLECEERSDRTSKNFQACIAEVMHQATYVRYSDPDFPQYTNLITYLLACNNFEQYTSHRGYTTEFERLLLLQNYTIHDAPTVAHVDQATLFKSVSDAEGNGAEYVRISALIHSKKINAYESTERVHGNRATLNDKVIHKVSSFNSFYRSRVPDATLTDDEWAMLYLVYDSPQQKMLKDVVDERVASIHGIDALIENSKESFFRAAVANKIKYVLLCNIGLGFPFSLHESNFSSDISEDVLAALYDSFKPDDLKQISGLFDRNFRVAQDSKHDKAAVMARYVYSVYNKWIGVKFVSTKSVNMRCASTRCKIITRSLRLPETSHNAFYSAAKEGILHKFLSAIGTPTNVESIFRDNSELDA